MNMTMRFPNYEDCLMGVGQMHDKVVYVYDREQILTKIMNVSKCDYKAALSFFENVVNRDFGAGSPIFFSRIDNLLDV